MGYFPVDAETLRYMKADGSPNEVIERTEAYMRAQGYFPDGILRLTPNSPIRSNSDLDSGGTSLAGPKTSQDRVPMSELKETFEKA